MVACYIRTYVRASLMLCLEHSSRGGGVKAEVSRSGGREGEHGRETCMRSSVHTYVYLLE